MPNRIIKESICTSDSIDGLTWFEECFFYRLIVNCDDYGRMDARAPILRARLFPLKSVTDKQVESALQSLRTAAMIDLYIVDGRSYLQLRTWENHQSIRAHKSKYPAPQNLQADDFNCMQMISDDCKCPRNPIQSESNPNPNPIEDDTRTRDPAIASVMSSYMDKINPTPSPTSIDELKGYIGFMGAECCLRAIDSAIDAGARNWNYIRAILRSKQAQGVRCIADWDKTEEARAGKTKEEKCAGPESYSDIAARLKKEGRA